MVPPRQTALLAATPLTAYRAQQHPFHILPPSAYPPAVGLAVMALLLPLTAYLHGMEPFQLTLGRVAAQLFPLLFLIAMGWFSTIVQESAFGFHTEKVLEGLRLGMLLFILSEVMLFFAFFWGFFHVALSPSIVVGDLWPPKDAQIVSAWGLPLVNTLLLLSSGITVTLAHAFLVKGESFLFYWNLALTILLGIIFLLCQAYEYQYGILFSFREDIYGSIFFLTTGFHGLHVTVGTLFLAYSLFRHIRTDTPLFEPSDAPTLSTYFYPPALLERYLPGVKWSSVSPTKVLPQKASASPSRAFGLEAGAWYWHFVDVVWLFLFLAVYWWGGSDAVTSMSDVAASTATPIGGLESFAADTAVRAGDIHFPPLSALKSGETRYVLYSQSWRRDWSVGWCRFRIIRGPSPFYDSIRLAPHVRFPSAEWESYVRDPAWRRWVHGTFIDAYIDVLSHGVPELPPCTCNPWLIDCCCPKRKLTMEEAIYFYSEGILPTPQRQLLQKPAFYPNTLMWQGMVRSYRRRGGWHNPTPEEDPLPPTW